MNSIEDYAKKCGEHAEHRKKMSLFTSDVMFSEEFWRYTALKYREALEQYDGISGHDSNEDKEGSRFSVASEVLALTKEDVLRLIETEMKQLEPTSDPFHGVPK